MCICNITHVLTSVLNYINLKLFMNLYKTYIKYMHNCILLLGRNVSCTIRTLTRDKKSRLLVARVF